MAVEMRSASTGAPPGLSMCNTTPFTFGLPKAFSRIGMMFSAEARSVAPIGPSMRTTPTTLPNGPQRKPVEFRKNRK